MIEQNDSSYAFIYNNYGADNICIDVYLPVAMLPQFQLTPGSAVLAQGLEPGPIELLQLRPSKGSDKPSMGKIAFIASVRLLNRPAALHSFLSEASKNGIRFASIRTQGLRSEQYADIVCEGGLGQVPPLFNPVDAISSQLAKTAREAQAEVLYSAPVYFSNSPSGDVGSSLYRLNTPVLRGVYRKVRFRTYGKSRVLRTHENKIALCRASLDAGRTTLTLDLSISALNAFLLLFESANLPPGSPVTETILSMLPDAVNVDALDAFEYVRFDPALAEPSATGIPGVRIGVIEMLLTCKEEGQFSCPEIGDALKQVLQGHSWWDEQTSRISITTLQQALSTTVKENIPEDTGCKVFQKLLKDGQYAYVEHLGQGSFGVVNKYIDLNSHQVVAGKHIKDPKEFSEGSYVHSSPPGNRDPVGIWLPIWTSSKTARSP